MALESGLAVKYAAGVAIGLAVLLVGWYLFQIFVTNPRVMAELERDPNGERAGRVMMLALPSGKSIPVNYLREGEMVYAGADGRWWHELRTPGADVRVVIRGDELTGHALAVEGNPVHTEDVFRRLRPTSYKWIGGVLIEIKLDTAL